MDIYKEQLVSKKPTGKDWTKRILILLGAGILILGSCFVLPISGQLWFFPVLVIIIVVYCLFRYYSYLEVEYEYIFTNGDLDVDKIIGKAKRSRLAAFDMAYADEFGKYDPAAFEGKEYHTKILACSAPTDPDTYYLIVNHQKLQRCLVIFNPNDIIRDSIIEYLPRTAAVHV